MLVTIKTKSYTIIGSAEATSLIDTDIVFDPDGLPYIPSRRIKGLLRKSAMDICDISGKDRDIVNRIFGTGDEEGKLRIDNFYLKNYKELKEAIRCYDRIGSVKPYITRDDIIESFTELRERTAIDQPGIAREGSLRVYRALKPGIEFAGLIDDSLLSDSEERHIFNYALKNLRRIGMQINRGYGRIDISISDEKNKDNTTLPFRPEATYTTQDTVKIPFTVETLLPVVIAKQAGGPNFVETYRYIPSTTLRGAFIKEMPFLAEEIINGNLIITPAYPYVEEKEFYPAPRILEREKDKEEEVLFIKTDKIEKKTKPLETFIHIVDDKYFEYSPHTITFFHTTVNDILKGSASEEGFTDFITGGGIFNYEAIESGEVFKGYIICNGGLFRRFSDSIKEEFEARIGRSKYVQYGRIKIRFLKPEKVEPLDIGDEFYIVFTSPAIFYNEFGKTEVSTTVIKRYLDEFFGCDVEVSSAVLGVEYLEGFINKWNCKNNRELALKEGSTIHVKLNNHGCLEKKITDLLNYGIGERTIHGFGRVKIFEGFSNYEKKTLKAEKKPLKEYHKGLLRDILYSSLKRRVKVEALKMEEKNIRMIPSTLIERLKRMIEKADGTSKKLEKWLDKREKGS